MSRNCGTCVHWTPPSMRTDYRNVFRGPVADKQYGVCEAVKLASEYDEAPEPLPLAVTKDGSDYKADLHTLAEFGCVLYEGEP